MLVWFANLIIVFFNLAFVEKYLHIFQLKDYNAKRYLSHFRIKILHFSIFLLVFSLQMALKSNILLIVSNLVVCLLNAIYSAEIIKGNKTPLVKTKKLNRLMWISSIIIALPCLFFRGGIVSTFVLLYSPIIANLLNFYDKIQNKKFIETAKKKLENSKAKIIAITGSNGKTSVKNILCSMLNDHHVLASPKSYNTPLGLSKFINENEIENLDFIILEYGARHIGDIRKLCKTFGADYGIITTVAPQHLESFKNINNVAKTKAELAEFLGLKTCVFNLDNIHTYKMWCDKPGEKIGVSIYSPAQMFITNLQINERGMNFKINTQNGEFRTKTKLLGRHNATNILLATAMALKLGVDIKQIVKSISKLDYTPHRLQLISGKINILDDSYNCSILSATEALFVLKNFKGKKVVATPGIIECGEMEFEINFKLGEMLAECDEVIIIGQKNKRAITRGLQSKNFKKILYADTLDNAKYFFKKLNEGDTLLLLNDLPDDYK